MLALVMVRHSSRLAMGVVLVLGGCVRAGFAPSLDGGVAGGDMASDQRHAGDSLDPVFPGGWGRKCPLRIPVGTASETLSDFPVLLTRDTLPEEMFDADGPHPAQDGAGDLRFTADSSGATRLACEIVTFATDNDPANGRAQIYVNVH